jgi:lipopolysaccharide transport system permease protein
MSAAAIGIDTFDRDLSRWDRVTHELRELWAFRHLVRHLVSTTLRAELSSSTLGFLWWFLDPLLLMGVYYVFIGLILRRDVAPHYPLFVLAAIISWEFFAKSITRTMGSTIAKEGSMRQVAFPRSAIPVAAVLTEAIHFAFAIGLFVAVLPLFGLKPGPIALLAIPIALLELVFALGMSFLFATANVFFRDVKHLTDHVFWLWFHLSPAIYPAVLFPARFRRIFELNPFANLFDVFRSVLMYNQIRTSAFLPLGLLGVAFLLVLAVGFVCFVEGSRSFAKVA